MKRTLKITILLLLALLFPATATAYDFEVDGIYYNIINGNNASVTYKGKYSSSVQSYSGNVTIPATVTYNSTTYPVASIGEAAFYGCSGLTSVTIGNSVTSIGNYAFSGCSGLTSIDIPNSVTAIGILAFSECSGLTGVIIPNSVTSIGYGAFYQCYDLTSIDIPNTVIIIGSDAFYGTAWYDNQPDGLVYAAHVAYKYKGTMVEGTNIILQEGTKSITPRAFYGCSGLTSIDIPNSVTSIGGSSFSGCSGLTSIEIPNSVTAIGDGAFSGCSGMTNIDIPNSVTSIGWFAFCRCIGLTSVTIPDSVTFIGCGAFADCSALNTLNFNAISCDDFDINSEAYAFSNTNISTINIGNSVQRVPAYFAIQLTNLTSIEIPNSVASIGEAAFSGCSGLTSVTIGNSVTSIGERAFDGCNSILDLYSYAYTPPECYENTFSTYSSTLHVPASSLAAFFTAPYWCNFTNIIGDAMPLTSITLNKESIEVLKGDQVTIRATLAPTNAMPNTVTWQSSDETIAQVEDGVVTAIKCGECDIIATCQGKRAVCHVIVNISISLDSHKAAVLPNHIILLTPTVSSVPTDLVVTSSNPEVAAARLAGNRIQVVGVSEGQTTIMVNSADGYAFSDSCLVTVYTERGDVNSDGFVNIADVSALIDYLLDSDASSVNTVNADANANGDVTIADVSMLIDYLLGNAVLSPKDENEGIDELAADGVLRSMVALPIPRLKPVSFVVK